MSFFDEADDEPRSAPRRPPPRRGGGSSGSRSGGGGRGRPPRDHHHAIQARRRNAVIGVVIVIIIVAVAVKGCESSTQKTNLRDYANQVDAIIQSSQATRNALFRSLDGAAGKGATTTENAVGSALAGARRELSQAESQSVPSPMSPAQSKLVEALQFRVDGISIIYDQIEPALGSSTAAKPAVDAITAAMYRFAASDVIYKAYAGPDIAAALHAHGLAVGGVAGSAINPGQFLPALGWLQPVFVADKIGSKAPAATGHVNTTGHGTHGHELNAVSVGATTLQPGTTNTLPASPAPSFLLSITNSGSNTEYGVKCKVSIAGLNDTAVSTIAETTPGETTDCTVTLPHAATAGTFEVTAEVEPVPGETNIANNSKTYAVQFTG